LFDLFFNFEIAIKMHIYTLKVPIRHYFLLLYTSSGYDNLRLVFTIYKLLNSLYIFLITASSGLSEKFRSITTFEKQLLNDIENTRTIVKIKNSKIFVKFMEFNVRNPFHIQFIVFPHQEKTN
jgi:hypothetical protein